MKIYLAGYVPKSIAEEMNFVNWRIQYAEVLKKRFDCECIDPLDTKRDESDPMAIFSTDCKHISNSDMVVVNAEKNLGPGTSMEMVIAKYFKKPVVTVLPKNSVHRKQNHVINNQKVEDWVHAFVFATSDLIVENVEEVQVPKDIKDFSVIDEM